MKRISLFLLCLISLPALSADYCPDWGEWARSVMIERQNNKPISEIIEREVNGNFKDTKRYWIISAYEEPSFSNADIKKMKADKFANEVMLECYKSN